MKKKKRQRTVELTVTMDGTRHGARILARDQRGRMYLVSGVRNLTTTVSANGWDIPTAKMDVDLLAMWLPLRKSR